MAIDRINQFIMAQKNGNWGAHKEAQKMRLFNEFIEDGEQMEYADI